MRKRHHLFFVLALLVICSFVMIGCEPPIVRDNNISVTATAGLGSQLNGQIQLVDTDDLDAEVITLSGVNKPTHVVISPDEMTAYVCGSDYNPSDDVSDIVIVDLRTKTRNSVPFKVDGGLIKDMAINADGSKLVVLTDKLHTGALGGQIEIYDTATMTLAHDIFDIYSDTNTHSNPKTMCLHNTLDVIYVIANKYLPFGPEPVLRGFNFDGTQLFDMIHIGKTTFLDGNDYDLGVSPNERVLYALSNDVYPFELDETDGSIAKILYGTEEIDGLTVTKGVGYKDSPVLAGKTTLNFIKTNSHVWVTSSGYHVSPFNLGGGALLLREKLILKQVKKPDLYTLIDFAIDLIPLALEQLTGIDREGLQNIMDYVEEHVGFYGVAVAITAENMCHMVIAPIIDPAIILPDVSTYLCVSFKYGNIQAIHTLPRYPNGIATNRDNTQIVITYPKYRSMDNTQIELIKRVQGQAFDWKSRESKELNSGQNPYACGMASFDNPE